MIELRRASLIRNGRILLHPVSLCLGPGLVTAVTGPNGAGKTTLLRVMAGLWRPSEGEVLLDGKIPGAADRAQIGLVLQESMLYGGLTVRENLRFFGRLYRVPDLGGRIAALAEEFAFERRLDDPVARLSKGYTQRVALARAFLPAPRLLLLDEPFDGLDPGMHELVTEGLTRRVQNGATAVVVTHDLDFAGRADVRVAVNRGRVNASFSALGAGSANERRPTQGPGHA
ncbi:MAG: ABC transporter ATP-binding protein [Kyrpidia sp.]|nr:ABC transporter ATP-binding protein [Kyrpidia sp.]